MTTLNDTTYLQAITSAKKDGDWFTVPEELRECIRGTTLDKNWMTDVNFTTMTATECLKRLQSNYRSTDTSQNYCSTVANFGQSFFPCMDDEDDPDFLEVFKEVALHCRFMTITTNQLLRLFCYVVENSSLFSKDANPTLNEPEFIEVVIRKLGDGYDSFAQEFFGKWSWNMSMVLRYLLFLDQHMLKYHSDDTIVYALTHNKVRMWYDKYLSRTSVKALFTFLEQTDNWENILDRLRKMNEEHKDILAYHLVDSFCERYVDMFYPEKTQDFMVQYRMVEKVVWGHTEVRFRYTAENLIEFDPKLFEGYEYHNCLPENAQGMVSMRSTSGLYKRIYFPNQDAAQLWVINNQTMISEYYEYYDYSVPHKEFRTQPHPTTKDPAFFTVDELKKWVLKQNKDRVVIFVKSFSSKADLEPDSDEDEGLHDHDHEDDE